MARKKRRKHHKTGFVSNIKINIKVAIIFGALIFSLAIMFAGMLSIVYSQRDENKRESEISAVSAAQKYTESSIENMIEISKTIYTNKALYEFLNHRYESAKDYFTALSAFNDRKNLVLTEETSVKKFVIYTSNDTVLDGQFISRFENAEAEAWYERYKLLRRDMFIYCDEENQQISLIRKLNFRSVTTGEAIMKLDFNMSNLRNGFDEIYFDGDIYVTSDSTLLYSSDSDSKYPSDEIIDKGTQSSVNYYTCDITVLASGVKKNLFDVLLKPSVIPIALFFVICQTIMIIIFMDFKNRTIEVCEICTDKKTIRSQKKIQFGEDEIGKLYKDVNNTLLDIYRLNDEKSNLRKFIDEYKERTNEVIIRALDFDTRIRFNLEQDINIEESVPFNDEITIMKSFLDELRSRSDFRYTLISDTEATEKTIIPYSLSAIALHIAEYGSTDTEMEIDIREFDDCYRIRFYKCGVSMSAAELLRLRAVFEPDGDRSLPSFEAGDEFNPYIRLSRFYGNDISFIINTKEEIDFELIIKNKAD